MRIINKVEKMAQTMAHLHWQLQSHLIVTRRYKSNTAVRPIVTIQQLRSCWLRHQHPRFHVYVVNPLRHQPITPSTQVISKKDVRFLLSHQCPVTELSNLSSPSTLSSYYQAYSIKLLWALSLESPYRYSSLATPSAQAFLSTQAGNNSSRRLQPPAGIKSSSQVFSQNILSNPSSNVVL